jgi:hypothetical protein
MSQANSTSSSSDYGSTGAANAEILESLATLKRDIAELKEWQKASFYNQIALANTTHGPFTLLTPWSTGCKRMSLERLESKTICFTTPPAQNKFKNPIFVTTIPKSGTWLIGNILKVLGLQNVINGVGGSDGFPCYPVAGDNERLSLPYEVYSSLIQPGQFILSHIGDPEIIAWSHRNDDILLSLRNPRAATISYLRYVNPVEGKIPGQKFFTPAQLVHFIKSSPEMRVLHVVLITASIIQNFSKIHTVRFEELTSKDRNDMKPSVESIAKVTGLPDEEIYQAIAKSLGANSLTYSGSLSQLDGIWTQEVEDAFVACGLDVLSEKLGYPRHYSPKK